MQPGPRRRSLVVHYVIGVVLIVGAILYADTPVRGDANALLQAGACVSKPAGSPDSLFGEGSPCPNHDTDTGPTPVEQAAKQVENQQEHEQLRPQATTMPTPVPQEAQETEVVPVSTPCPSATPVPAHVTEAANIVYVTAAPVAVATPTPTPLPATGGTGRLAP